MELSYGSNPHQAARFVPTEGPQFGRLDIQNFRQLTGKALSASNYIELDIAVETLARIAATYEIAGRQVPCVAVALKHGVVCGVGVADRGYQALIKMHVSDTQSITGAVITTNFSITIPMTCELHRRFGGQPIIDVIAAPSFNPKAIEKLKRVRGGCRVFSNKSLGNISRSDMHQHELVRTVRGGEIRDKPSTFVFDIKHPELEYVRKPSAQAVRDIGLAWAIGSLIPSNSITLTRHGVHFGSGGAAVNRRFAVEDALSHALWCEHTIDAEVVAYSDSFFPHIDGIKFLAQEGVTTIFASRGSIRDNEVFAAACEHSVNLLTIPDASCRGFKTNGM